MINNKAECPEIVSGLKLLAVFIFLTISFAGAAIAQSKESDNPTLMTSNKVEGVLPKGKPTVHYYGFTAGPGEVNIVFEFLSSSGNPVGGQLTDSYGRAFTELNAKEENRQANRKSVSGMLLPPELTLSGRFSIPRRQKLVIKVYTELFDTDDPVKYKIRVESANASFGNESQRDDQPAAPAERRPDHPPAAEKKKTTAPVRQTNAAANRQCTAKCAQQHIECIRKYSGTGACIVTRTRCLSKCG